MKILEFLYRNFGITPRLLLGVLAILIIVLLGFNKIKNGWNEIKEDNSIIQMFYEE